MDDCTFLWGSLQPLHDFESCLFSGILTAFWAAIEHFLAFSLSFVFLDRHYTNGMAFEWERARWALGSGQGPCWEELEEVVESRISKRCNDEGESSVQCIHSFYMYPSS